MLEKKALRIRAVGTIDASCREVASLCTLPAVWLHFRQLVYYFPKRLT